MHLHHAEAARVARPGAGLFLFTFSRHTLADDALPDPGESFVFYSWNGEPQCFLRDTELLAELEGVARAERASRAAAAIELVGLKGFESKYPKQLSGGMKMRASLARTLVLDPSVFLFDEPFGAVDEITRERLNDEVISLFARQRFAGLFITHSISEAVFLSTRVLVMSARPGRIVADFAIPFAYPRVPELRFEPEFARLCGELSYALRNAHSETHA